MSQYRKVGPDRRDEVAPQRARHDMRRSGVKMAEALRTPIGGLVVLLICSVLGFAIPAVSDVAFVIGLGFALFIKKAQDAYMLPAKMPRQSGLVDPQEINPGNGKPSAARGTFYLGNDRASGEEIWLTNRDAGVHMLVLGTTGSGKAQPLWAKVLTPRGWVSMGSLREGDLVVTPGGAAAPVTGVFPQGELAIYEVLLCDGRRAWACADHLWKAQIEGAERVVRTAELRHALAQGYIASLPVADIQGRQLGWSSIRSISEHSHELAQCIMVDHPEHLYITDDCVVTHNTEMLLGLCQNALNQGSGFMFVDGKAQDKIAFKIQDLCRARGRDDDVLILNFMTGARDIIGPQPNKITHTMNPFSYGSSGMVSQIVVGLMSSGGGGDDMWKDRAISFVEAISPPLTYLRDRYGLILDVNEYRKYFEIDRLEELCWKGAEKYPGVEQVLDPLRNYLLNLPGYDKAKYGKRGGQGDDTKLQHGYITMQLVRAFTSLADTYGHIVRVPLGEVYFPDVVKQRRILIAMLPSLEKTPSETANIGKIIVTALRNIMAEGLGSTLEGARDDLENEDGRALLPPYVVILDEYGYYAVKGFAVAFAQARSLGFVCVVGGQDLASFQRESKEEAVSICGNTRIKAFGSLEDPEQTMDFAVKTAGKALVADSGGFEGDVGAFSMKYADSLNVHLKAIDRIDPSDIKEQIEGQFTFVWRSRVISAQTYYVNPRKVKRLQLNHFLQVPPPDQLQLDEIEAATSGLAERLATADLAIVDAPSSREIDTAVAALEGARELGAIEQGIASIVAVACERERVVRSFREAVRSGGGGHRAEARDGEEAASPSSSRSESGEFDAEEFLAEMTADSQQVTDSSVQQPERGVASQAQAEPISHEELEASMRGTRSAVETLLDAPDPATDSMTPLTQMSVFAPGKQTGFGADVFAADSAIARSVEENLVGPDDPAPLLDFNATLKGVESIERQMGATPEEASAAARSVVKRIEEATRYPQSVPAEKSPEQVIDLLEQLIKELEGA